MSIGHIHLVAIYTLPLSMNNQLTTEIFFSEFPMFLEEISIFSGILIMFGHFNFDLDPQTTIFLNHSESFNLTNASVGAHMYLDTSWIWLSPRIYFV